MTFLLLLTLGCGPSGCEKMCLDQEEVNATVVEGAGGTLDRDAYRAMCAAAAGSDCEACHIAIGEHLIAEHAVAPDCGCGFSTEEVGECRFDEDITDEQAAEVVANCEHTCSVYAL